MFSNISSSPFRSPSVVTSANLIGGCCGHMTIAGNSFFREINILIGEAKQHDANERHQINIFS